MGRKRSTNTNLPDRMRARKRTRKNGKTTVYYFYDGRDENGRRKEIPLGTDYIAAVQEWSKLEAAKLPRAARVTFPVAAARFLNTVISHRSSNTVSGAQKAVRKLSEFFGGNNPAPLDDIEPAHVRRYLDCAKTRRAVQTMRLLTSAPFSITPANKAGHPKKTHAETSKNTTRNAVKSILRITYIRPSIKPPTNRCAT